MTLCMNPDGLYGQLESNIVKREAPVSLFCYFCRAVFRVGTGRGPAFESSSMSSDNLNEMKEQKKLYPIRFKEETLEYPWGRKTFSLADLGAVDSVAGNGWLAGNAFSDIMETYLERVGGEDVYKYYGRQFPVSVSFLDINGVFPARCHPDDEAAGQRYDALGKRVFWRVLEAAPDARLYIGFARDMSASDFYGSVLSGTLRETLNVHVPAAGESFCIAPGTVYAAEGRMKILEISESSLVAFILEGQAEAPQAGENAAEALDLINLGRTDFSQALRPAGCQDAGSAAGTAAGSATGDGVPSEGCTELLSSPEFSVNGMSVSEPLKLTSGDSFTVLVCTQGGISVQVKGRKEDGTASMDNYSLHKGESLLVPADVEEFFLVPVERGAEVLSVFMDRHEDVDSYINPDTDPYLDGEDYEGVEDMEDEEA